MNTILNERFQYTRQMIPTCEILDASPTFFASVEKEAQQALPYFFRLWQKRGPTRPPLEAK